MEYSRKNDEELEQAFNDIANTVRDSICQAIAENYDKLDISFEQAINIAKAIKQHSWLKVDNKCTKNKKIN